ncbi:DinB family protein [Bacillus sp. T33-2]|uniref:DinB family protein n=1 Tax=Bacillus sp. T33-2 TaxID=2054168 RepID=UPI0015E09346|nr:DinB family protein [Bacillus sp. T33-2]
MEHAVWTLAEDVRKDTLGILESIPEDLWDVVPEGFNNSVRWNAGHILMDQYLWFYHKIEDEMPLQGIEAFFAYGTSPKSWDAMQQPPSREEILAFLKEQIPFLKETFQYRLDEPLLAESESGIKTIGDVISRTLYHEGLHAGALIAMRRHILEGQQLHT